MTGVFIEKDLEVVSKPFIGSGVQAGWDVETQEDIAHFGDSTSRLNTGFGPDGG